jgi:hypothetical protein
MKRLVGLFFACFLLLITANTVFGQEKSTLIAPGYPGRDVLTGENHHYSLVLKGNGNAVLLGRILFSNQEANPLDQYQLNLPGVQVDNLVAFQEIQKPVCQQYSPTPLPGQPPTCLVFGPPLYPDPYNSEYRKLEVEKNGDQYTFRLAEVVKEASFSGVVFSYNSNSYTTQRLGKWNFKFDTPQTSSAIQNLNMSIDTDNRSLHLDVDGEKVNYNGATDLKTESLSAADAARSIAPMIGTGGRVYKSVSSLTAGESVRVSGSFSESIWLLKLNQILWFLGTLLITLLVVFLIIKADFWTRVSGYFQKLTPKNSREILVLDLFASLCSSALVFGSILMMANLLEGGGVYQILPVPTGLGAALTLLVSLLGFVFVLVVLALPSLVLGLRFGWRHTLYYILFEFMWLGVMVVGFAIIFSDYSNPVHPLRGATLEGQAPIIDTPIQTD